MFGETGELSVQWFCGPKTALKGKLSSLILKRQCGTYIQ